MSRASARDIFCHSSSSSVNHLRETYRWEVVYTVNLFGFWCWLELRMEDEWQWQFTDYGQLAVGRGQYIH
jgi:hypothetical protein